MKLNQVEFIGWDKFVVVEGNKLGLSVYMVLRIDIVDQVEVLGTYLSEVYAIRAGLQVVAEARKQMERSR